MNKEINSGKYWIHFGMNWKRVALGFSIDRYALSIDIGPFWFGLEW
jgi:hypothetical protein